MGVCRPDLARRTVVSILLLLLCALSAWLGYMDWLILAIGVGCFIELLWLVGVRRPWGFALAAGVACSYWLGIEKLASFMNFLNRDLQDLAAYILILYFVAIIEKQKKIGLSLFILMLGIFVVSLGILNINLQFTNEQIVLLLPLSLVGMELLQPKVPIIARTIGASLLMAAVLMAWNTLFDDSYLFIYWLPAIFLVICFDTGSYIVGKRIGKNPILPITSPKKTWEGFFGGIACSCLAWAGMLFFGQGNLLFLPLSFAAFILVICCAFYGDYFESRIKRAFDKKDSGFLLPGHGGLLDRFDSMLFLPIIVLVAKRIADAW